MFYEAPHRIRASLADAAAVLGPREAVVARELTKLHEELLRGTLDSLRDAIASRGGVKGEIVLVVAGAAEAEAEVVGAVEDRVDELTAAGASRMEAIKQAARERGLSKREVYQRMEAIKQQDV